MYMLELAGVSRAMGRKTGIRDEKHIRSCKFNIAIKGPIYKGSRFIYFFAL